MKLDRREFMKCTLGAGICAGLEPAVFAGQPTRLPVRTAAETSKSDPLMDSTHSAILAHAAMAPSGHNSQPWRVRLMSSDEWVIEADPSRRLPSVDPDNRELMLSLGAFAENLLLAAGALGYAGELQTVASAPSDREVLRVRLYKDKVNAYPLRRLATRMTAKLGYRPVEIRSADIETFRSATGDRVHYFPKGSRHAACIREATTTCFRAQTGRDAAQQEFVRWLRLSGQDVEERRDGLTAAGMGVQGIKGWFLGHFVKPEDFMKTSYRKQSIDSVARLTKEGGGWLVMTSPGREVNDLIEAGRRFERMAILARESGIGLHPMTQVLEEQQGLEQIAGNHAAGTIPQFVIRVGYLGKYPEPVSPRRPVDWFTYR
jgi:hypothetical protein